MQVDQLQCSNCNDCSRFKFVFSLSTRFSSFSSHPAKSNERKKYASGPFTGGQQSNCCRHKLVFSLSTHCELRRKNKASTYSKCCQPLRQRPLHPFSILFSPKECTIKSLAALSPSVKFKIIVGPMKKDCW